MIGGQAVFLDGHQNCLGALLLAYITYSNEFGKDTNDYNFWGRLLALTVLPETNWIPKIDIHSPYGPLDLEPGIHKLNNNLMPGAYDHQPTLADVALDVISTRCYKTKQTVAAANVSFLRERLVADRQK